MKTKKVFALILAPILLTGCNTRDEIAQKMIDDIEAIGDVNIYDEDAINKAEALYNTLTENQKNQVTNYIKLVEARRQIDILIAQKEKSDAAKIEDEYQENYNKVVELIFVSGTTAYLGCDLIYTVWHNAIFEVDNSITDKYTKHFYGDKNEYFYFYDFNKAVLNLRVDSGFQDILKSTDESKETISTIMDSLNNPPEKWELIYQELEDYYDAYIELTNLLKTPTGNLTTYSSKYEDVKNSFDKSYEKLKRYIDYTV